MQPRLGRGSKTGEIIIVGGVLNFCGWLVYSAAVREQNQNCHPVGMSAYYRVEILPRGMRGYITPSRADEQVQPIVGNVMYLYNLLTTLQYMSSALLLCFLASRHPTRTHTPHTFFSSQPPPPFPPSFHTTQRPELHNNSTTNTHSNNNRRHLILVRKREQQQEDHDQLRRGSPDTITPRQPGR